MTNRMSDSDAKYFSEQVRLCKKQCCVLILCEMERAREAEKDLRESRDRIIIANGKLTKEKHLLAHELFFAHERLIQIEKENAELVKENKELQK